MTPSAALAVVVAGDLPLVDDLAEAIGVEALRLGPEDVSGTDAKADWSGERVVWIHIVPALPGGESLEESETLLASARAAERTAAEASAALTFLVLLPSRGLFAGSAGLACDLASGALEGLMRAEIGNWSAEEKRIAGIVYGGIQGHRLDGQRPEDEVRKRTPIGALAKVEQLADAIRYLGSPRAAYVTGTLLHVDGGWNAYSWIYPARTI